MDNKRAIKIDSVTSVFLNAKSRLNFIAGLKKIPLEVINIFFSVVFYFKDCKLWSVIIQVAGTTDAEFLREQSVHKSVSSHFIFCELGFCSERKKPK